MSFMPLTYHFRQHLPTSCVFPLKKFSLNLKYSCITCIFLSSLQPFLYYLLLIALRPCSNLMFFLLLHIHAYIIITYTCIYTYKSLLRSTFLKYIYLLISYFLILSEPVQYWNSLGSIQGLYPSILKPDCQCCSHSIFGIRLQALGP